MLDGGTSPPFRESSAQASKPASLPPASPSLLGETHGKFWEAFQKDVGRPAALLPRQLPSLGLLCSGAGVLPLPLTERAPSLYHLILSANPCQSACGDLTFVMVTKQQELPIPAPRHVSQKLVHVTVDRDQTSSFTCQPEPALYLAHDCSGNTQSDAPSSGTEVPLLQVGRNPRSYSHLDCSQYYPKQDN